MKLLADSSAFAKRYVQETGSQDFAFILEGASELALSVLLMPEIISGLNRRRREGILSAANYRQLKSQLLQDINDVILLQLTPAVISHSIKLLENNTLRAMDVLHIACAIEWKADLFVTADKRQHAAAVHAGLRTELIG